RRSGGGTGEMTTFLRRRLTPDFMARALVGVLFAIMSFKLFVNFLQTGRVTGLLLLASEFLVLVFTVLRRPAPHVDRSTGGRLMTTVSMVGPQLLTAASVPSLAPDVLTAVVSAIGFCVVISGKLALGRSFGLIPANRGVVVQGPYMVVRHPIYLGYLVTHAAFLVANPSPLNLAVLLVADSALIARALIEERVLRLDATYEAYCQRVGWHLVPGVF
ncbi:MAG TPA: methyltransferase, partial [Vicinamibacterales bacterium]